VNLVIECVENGIVVSFHVDDCHAAAALRDTGHLTHGFADIGKVMSSQSTNNQLECI
jgi:hypothetical protein